MPDSPAAPPPAPPDAAPARKGHPAVRLLFGLVALGALIGLVGRFGDAKHFVALAEDARPEWMVLAVALQASTYACEAGVWRTVLVRGGASAPFGRLYALSLMALFTNQMVPTAGVAGTFVVVRALAARGAPYPVAVATVLVDLVGYYAAFGVAIAFSLVVIRVHHDLSPLVLVPAGVMAALGFAISAGAWWLASPGRTAPRWTRRIPGVHDITTALVSADSSLVRSLPLLAAAFALRLGNFAADGLTVWACLRAVGQATPAPEAIAALVVGSIARVLGIVPGGLGTFEGAAVGGLALFGVAVEPGLTAVLLFRGLSFWLPMLPGLWLGHRFAREGT